MWTEGRCFHKTRGHMDMAKVSHALADHQLTAGVVPEAHDEGRRLPRPGPAVCVRPELRVAVHRHRAAAGPVGAGPWLARPYARAKGQDGQEIF